MASKYNLKIGDIIVKSNSCTGNGLRKNLMKKTKILDLAIVRLTCLSNKNLSDIEVQTQKNFNESFKKIMVTVLEEQKSRQLKGKTQCICIKLQTQSITCLSI